MRISLSIATAALLAFGCASSNPETRTARGIPQGTWSNGANDAPPVQGRVQEPSPSPTAATAQSTTDNNTGVRTVTAPVVAVGQDSIQFGPSVGNVTLKVDSGTSILRDGRPVAEGLSAIREGQQVRASFDPTQNHATRIELLPAGMSQGVNGTVPHQQPKAPPSDATTAPQQPPGR